MNQQKMRSTCSITSRLSHQVIFQPSGVNLDKFGNITTGMLVKQTEDDFRNDDSTIGSDPAVHECWTISALEGLIQRLQVYGSGIAEHAKDEPRPRTQETFCRRDIAPRLGQVILLFTTWSQVRFPHG